VLARVRTPEPARASSGSPAERGALEVPPV
jgi:hypothetical protein